MRGAILTYHAIDCSGSMLSTSPHAFAEQMRVLAESGARIVPLTELPSLISAPSTQAPVVALTFDDGFLSVYEHALPVLARYGFPATVFVVSDYCGRTNSWPSQPAQMKHQPLLDWRELHELVRAGVSAGCHTRTHPDLRNLATREILQEITGAKSRIEDALRVPVKAFAYPYGAYNRNVRALVASELSLACSTALGFVMPDSDPFALERLDMYYLRRPPIFARLFTPSVRNISGSGGAFATCDTEDIGHTPGPDRNGNAPSPVTRSFEQGC
jgi:peptidoglycan/xylan/chitin deacetylase (PgdA/CDA1 family)